MIQIILTIELVREIIYPTENNYTIYLPDEMIGKQIEVIAFEIEKTQEKRLDKMARLSDSLDSLKIDLSDFKFNRDEANDTV